MGSIYAIDKKHHHLFGAELNGNINNGHAVSAGDYCKFTDANKMLYQGVSDMNDRNNTDYLNAVLSYNWKIDEKDSYLKVLGNYNYKHANKGNSFVASYEDYEPLHTDESIINQPRMPIQEVCRRISVIISLAVWRFA